MSHKVLQSGMPRHVLARQTPCSARRGKGYVLSSAAASATRSDADASTHTQHYISHVLPERPSRPALPNPSIGINIRRMGRNCGTLRRSSDCVPSCHCVGDLSLIVDNMAHQRLPEDVVRRLFQQLVVAIDYCHRLGIANRDIKVRAAPSGRTPILNDQGCPCCATSQHSQGRTRSPRIGGCVTSCTLCPAEPS